MVVVYGATTLEALDEYNHLRHQGYSNARLLSGGFLHWMRLEYPVER